MTPPHLWLESTIVGSGFFLQEFAMKILVPVIHWSVSSDAAYRIGDIADSLKADILVLFVVPKFNLESYRRGETAIEIFEEAVHDCGIAVSGFVVTGSPTEAVGKVAKSEQIDMIILGAKSEEKSGWRLFSEQLHPNVTCEIHLLDDDRTSDISLTPSSS